MACGDRLEDGQTEYTGLCSGINDPGNETTCSEQFQSCMSVIMSEFQKLETIRGHPLMTSEFLR